MNISKKAPGFFVSIAACALSLVAAIAYGVLFSKIQFKEPVWDVNICIALGVGAVVALALVLLGKHTIGYAPAVLAIASGIAFMLFINIAIWPIASSFWGEFPEIGQLIVCAVLILATLVVSEVALYMKKFHPTEE